MTISILDPKTALIVIDLQKGIVTFPVVHPIEQILANAARLTNVFRSRNLPVALVNVTGGAPGRTESNRKLEGLPADWAELVPELNLQPSDLLSTKKTWGAFTNTDLEKQLRNHGVTQLVLAGCCDFHWRGVDRASRLRARIQRHVGSRCHDRHEPRGP